MRFGKRDEEWHRVFIWWPLRLNDGRWIWLETMEKRQRNVGLSMLDPMFVTEYRS